MKKFFVIFLIFLYNAINVKAQNPCSGVFAGSVPHPDPRRCSEFYVCIFFFATLQQCEPNHIFDGSSGNCVPGDPSTCLQVTSPLPSTSTIATTTTESVTVTTSLPEITSTSQEIESTTTSNLNLEEICRNVFFAARPHPFSIYLFIGCIRGDGMVLSCISGEFFDSSILECAPIPCSVPENICEGIDLRVIANPCSCFRYVVCYIGEVVINAECPLENIFDQTSGACRPGNWETCDLYPELSPPTTTTTVATTSTLLLNPCQGVILGNRPMEGSCTMYYRCVNSVPQPQSCNPGEIFDRNQLICVVGNVDECELIN